MCVCLCICGVTHGKITIKWDSLVDLMVKNLPAVWESWSQSLGWEDLLEEELATHSSILAWRIPWTEEPGGLQSMGLQRVMTERLRIASMNPHNRNP